MAGSGRWTSCNPDELLTPARRAIAEREGLDPERAWESFQDHEFKPPGRLSVDRTWRTWCKRSAEYGHDLAREPRRPQLGEHVPMTEAQRESTERALRHLADLEAASVKRIADAGGPEAFDALRKARLIEMARERN